ncbi:MAG: hypothetical protein J6Y37_17245, partial [Paludibacteraceae bacterium]|nr:hypothetical protein [Paludibacteraceae bacterium]
MAKNDRKLKGTLNVPRVNDEIRGYWQVRAQVAKDDGTFRAVVMTLEEAKSMADELGLDVIEINSKQEPPIVR